MCFMDIAMQPRALDVNRRRFLRSAAMTIAATHLGLLRTADAHDGGSRELTALGNAPEWINSPHLTASSLAGKVVLVDFCTYTCINWLRTLPYIRAWSQKYRQALVVVGVHTPEFPFEGDVDNVRRELRRLMVDFPIAIDNSHTVWNGFDNNYWPALYLIDARGHVRHHQFGEGGYDESERAIQRLLAEADAPGAGAGAVPLGGTAVEAPADWDNLRSPENYVGYARTEGFASRSFGNWDRRHVYSVPARLGLNQWALDGEWTVAKHATVLSSAVGRIVYRFHARDLHLVMGAGRAGRALRFRVSLDGQPPGPAHGLDVDASGNGAVGAPRLYQLIRQPGPIVDRRFEIEFLDPGVETFSFTFG
jgi:hypothetical protein